MVQRPIVGFGRDAEDDWFVELSCGHRRHVRHRPPFFNRPWVTTEAGRNAKLGVALDCVRCDRFELPDSARLSRRTPVFTETTIPAGLRADHTTSAGVWAQIIVPAGRLRYIVTALDHDVVLTPEHPGLVLPEVRHRVQPIGAVRFFLEMYRV
jgi:tellurite resistance-related uncharacterized protein